MNTQAERAKIHAELLAYLHVQPPFEYQMSKREERLLTWISQNVSITHVINAISRAKQQNIISVYYVHAIIVSLHRQAMAEKLNMPEKYGYSPLAKILPLSEDLRSMKKRWSKQFGEANDGKTERDMAERAKRKIQIREHK